MRAAMKHHVSKLYDVNKNAFACIDSKDTGKAKVEGLHFIISVLKMGTHQVVHSTHAAPRRTVTLLHVDKNA